MKRNLAVSMILGALLLTQAAPLVAAGSHCPMRAPGVSLCSVCEFGGVPGHSTAVSASSCCRFEAANPSSQTPGVVPTAQKTPGPWPAFDSIASVDPARDRVAVREHLGSARAPLRSTNSPLILGTTLRL